MSLYRSHSAVAGLGSKPRRRSPDYRRAGPSLPKKRTAAAARRRLALEPLEGRQLLNAAPIAQDDPYQVFEGELLRVEGGQNTQQLIEPGAVWRYLDNGSNQGTAWRTAGFDDAPWSSGPAQLGYGEGDEATVVSFGNNPATKAITTYFRNHFSVPQGITATSLTMQLLRDDGAVVYINGQEAARVNMPAGLIGHQTLAVAQTQPENVFENLTLDADFLQSGDNVIAVEVHQVNGASNDISFDLGLTVAYTGAGGVLANDSDSDGDALTSVLVAGSGPAHGTLTFSASGSFEYQPEAGFIGVDSFQYQASDGALLSAPAMVTIFVNAAQTNHAPVANDDSYDVGPSGTLTVPAPGILSNDTDEDGDSLTAGFPTGPQNGSLSLGADGSFTYQATPGFVGDDSFTYRASDGRLDSNVATVTIHVSGPMNNAPVAQDDFYNTPEGQPIDIPATPGGDATLVAAGEFWRYLDDGSDQGVAWRQLGFDDSTWPVGAGELGYGDGDETTVVNAGNPTSRFITTYFRHEFSVADASDISALTVFLRRDDGAAVYLNGVEVVRDNLPPGAQYNTLASANAFDDGQQYFQFPISTAALVNGPNMLAVEVHQVALTSSDISFDLRLEAVLVGPAPSPAAPAGAAPAPPAPVPPPPLSGVLANDNDPDGDALRSNLVTPPSHGTLQLRADGSFTYVPDAGFSGTDGFSYVANDGRVDSNTAQVTIVVEPGETNMPPVAVSDQYSVAQGEVLQVGDTNPGQSTVLVPFGADWSYLDDGSNQGTLWRQPAFDDSLWNSGPGELGYGEMDEATVVGYGPSPSSKYVTTYFRHDFQVIDASAVGGLTIRLEYDDGAIIYLNGTEVGRVNMPSGMVGHQTFAPGNAPEGIIIELPIGASSLVSGTNVLAVEIHQVSLETTDLSFDLQLEASFGGPVGVLTNDSDPNGDPLSAQLVTGPAHGTLDLRPDGSFTYVPNSTYSGSDSFTYRAWDGAAFSGEASVTINVGSVTPPANLVVSTTVDENDGDYGEGDLSLREAVILANQRLGDDTIILPPGLYSLTIPGASEDGAQTGDLDITEREETTTILGAGHGQSIVDAGGLDRVFDVRFDARLRLEDVLIRGGVGRDDAFGLDDVGGGIMVHEDAILTLDRVAVVSNSAREGGGIWIDAAGEAHVQQSEIAGNQAGAGGGGGGIANVGQLTIVASTVANNTSAEDGGGISTNGTNSHLWVRDSTISGNLTQASGGGIASWIEATVEIVNSTISGNLAGRSGGGIFFNDDNQTLTIHNSTITANRAAVEDGESFGGGGIATETGTSLYNTILAGNFRGGVDATVNDDLRGFADGDYNLIGVLDGPWGRPFSVGNLTGTPTSPLDPRLGPLTGNGGPTLTHRLLLDSPALGAGDPFFDPASFAPLLGTDQRGALRVADHNTFSANGAPPLLRLDIGSFELQSTNLGASLRGTIWNDENANGLRDAWLTEARVPGVVLRAFDTANNFVGETVTDANGEFLFSGLAQGEYFVEIVPPAGATLSVARAGNLDFDSDFNRSTGRTERRSLAHNETTFFDAGLYFGPRSSELAGNLRVSEIQAFALTADYIELVNVGNDVLDLTGVRFVDGIAFEFTGSAMTSLFPGEHVVVIRDPSHFSSLHAASLDRINIAGAYLKRLNSDGERIVLIGRQNEPLEDFTFDGQWFAILDPMNFSLVVRDDAPADGDRSSRESWRPSARQNGSPGSADPDILPTPGSVVVSEVMSRPDAADSDHDWIELRNTTDQPIEVGGWYLGDEPAAGEDQPDFRGYRIAPGTVIAPHGYLVFTQAEHFGNAGDPGLRQSFGLSSFGDTVFLTAADDTGEIIGYSEAAMFGGAEVGVSIGRFEFAGASGPRVEFVALREPTPGADNSGPKVGPLVINEIMYHPAFTQDAFIEIRNTSDAAISLREPSVVDGDDEFYVGWELIGGAFYEFQPGQSIAPHGYALVVSIDPDVFRAKYTIPESVLVVGPYLGALDDDGDLVELRHHEVSIVRDDVTTDVFDRVTQIDRVQYDNLSPWSAAANQGGGSLERIDPTIFGDDPYSWGVTQFLGGTPGTANSITPAMAGDFNGDAQVNAADIDLLANIVGGGDPAQAAPLPVGASMPVLYDLTGDRYVTHADLDYLVRTVLSTEYGDADLSGVVDLGDLIVIQRNFGRTTAVGWTIGDVNGDGAVNRADIALLSRSFGFHRPSAPAPSAQPASLAATPVAAIDDALGQSAESSGRLTAARHRLAPVSGEAALTLPASRNAALSAAPRARRAGARQSAVDTVLAGATS